MRQATLTEQRIRELRLIAQGMTIPEVAELTKQNLRTVEHHLAELRKRFNAPNTPALLSCLIWNDLLGPKPEIYKL